MLTHVVARIDRNHQTALRQIQRRFNRFSHSGAGCLSSDQPIDHDVDRVLHLLVELKVVRQLDDLSVHPRPQEAAFQQILEQVFVLTLLPLDQRREDLELRAVGQTQDTVENVFSRLSCDRSAALMATRRADAGEEDAQIVVDLGDRADG